MPLVEGYSSDSEPDLPLTLAEPSIDIRPDVESNQPYQQIENVAAAANITVHKSFWQPPVSKRNKASGPKKIKKRKKGDIEGEYMGPWAKFDFSEDEVEPVQHTSSEEDADKETEQEDNVGEKEQEESKQTTDYLATYKYTTSFMDVPRTKIDLTRPIGSRECFVPKAVIHTFTGHEKGTSKLEVFPKSGHLFLSGGNDHIIRLWDLYHKRELVREYYGHSQPIKDLAFNSKGDQFLSCAFDRKVVLWDTKDGSILKTLKTKSVPTVVKFVPGSDKEFLVGLMNSNIEHYSIEDLTKPLQTYDHHVGCINTLCMIDNGKKFLSASDDKCIRIWNWGINIPVKTITHPTQYAISSAVVIPPDQELIALQNMNNAIQVIDGMGNYKFKKKRFKNENVTGHKVDIDVSPDGKIIMAGDSKGYALFWDWNTGKLVNKLKVGNGLINTIKFHPQEQSKVLAAGSDGKIYYCD